MAARVPGSNLAGLNSLPRSLRPYMLSLSLVSQFLLGPSLCQRSLPPIWRAPAPLWRSPVSSAPSGSRSLGGGGDSVTNHLDTDSPLEVVYTTTLLLHITHGLHFPSTIALITHLSPITHYTAGSDHTLYKSLGLPLSHC